MAVAIFDPHVDGGAAPTTAANDATCDRAEEFRFVRVGIFASRGLFDGLRRVRPPSISGELPDVASHVVKAVAVWGVFADLGGRAEAAGRKIGARWIGWRTTPREKAIGTAASSVFPLRFNGQAFSLPLAIGVGLKPTDVYHRMIFKILWNLAADPVLEVVAVAK